MLFGAAPVAVLPTSSSPASVTAKTLTSPLAAFWIYLKLAGPRVEATGAGGLAIQGT